MPTSRVCDGNDTQPATLLHKHSVMPAIGVHARDRLPQSSPTVFLLSYPKAGRTWLRALVGKALVEHYGLPEAALLDTSELTRAAGLPIAVFDHDQSALLTGLRWQAMPTDRNAYRGKRVLLLGRGVHDLVVSAYFQAKLRIHVYDGPISDFIRDERYGIDKILAFYRIWAMARHVPEAFEFIRYEELHRDPAQILARVLAFMGAQVSPAAIAMAVDYCRFENLRAAEVEDRFKHHALRRGPTDDPESFKVRKGKVGNFAEYLSPEDIAFIDNAVAARGCEFTRPASPAQEPDK